MLGALLGTIAGGIGTAVQNRKQRAYEREMYNLNKIDNISMWHMQNQYNSPEAQMGRMKAAGLNPNLMYGSPQSGGNSDQLSINKPDISPSKQFDSSAVQGLLSELYDLRQKDAQTDLTRQQIDTNIKLGALHAATTLLTQANTEGKDIDNRFQRESYPVRMEGLRATVDSTLQQILTGKATERNLDASTKLHEADTKKKTDELIMEWQRHKIHLPQMRAILAKIKAETENVQANTGLASANTRLSEQNRLNAKIDADLKELELLMTATGYNKNDGGFAQMLKSMMQATRSEKVWNEWLQYARERVKRFKRQ